MSKAGEIIKGLTEQNQSWSASSGQKLLEEFSSLREKYQDDRTAKDLLWYFHYIVESVAKGDAQGAIHYVNQMHNDFKRGLPEIE